MYYPTLGADPEFVAIADSTDILSAYGISHELAHLPIPGLYALGVTVETLTMALPYGTITPDGMAVEFTVTPTNDIETMIVRLRENIAQTQRILFGRGCSLTVEPHFFAHPEYIARLDPSYGKACSLQILGCAPDHCIYGIDLPDRPNPVTYYYRTTGGHIHIEVGKDILADRAALGYTVAALDYIIGTAGTYLCNSQQAYDRKKLYGSAGMIRTDDIRDTVLEYRTLPAQALIQTEDLARMMFTAAQSVVGHMMDVYVNSSQPDAIAYYRSIFGSYADIVSTIVPAINGHNVDYCRTQQEYIAKRLSACAIIDTTVNKLQSYVMPETFDVQWGTAACQYN